MLCGFCGRCYASAASRRNARSCTLVARFRASCIYTRIVVWEGDSVLKALPAGPLPPPDGLPSRPPAHPCRPQLRRVSRSPRPSGRSRSELSAGRGECPSRIGCSRTERIPITAPGAGLVPGRGRARGTWTRRFNAVAIAQRLPLGAWLGEIHQYVYALLFHAQRGDLHESSGSTRGTRPCRRRSPPQCSRYTLAPRVIFIASVESTSMTRSRSVMSPTFKSSMPMGIVRELS